MIRGCLQCSDVSVLEGLDRELSFRRPEETVHEIFRRAQVKDGNGSGLPVHSS